MTTENNVAVTTTTTGHQQNVIPPSPTKELLAAGEYTRAGMVLCGDDDDALHPHCGYDQHNHHQRQYASSTLLSFPYFPAVSLYNGYNTTTNYQQQQSKLQHYQHHRQHKQPEDETLKRKLQMAGWAPVTKQGYHHDEE